MDSVVRLDIGGRAYAKNYNTFSNLEMGSHFNCKTPVFQVQWFKKRFEKKTETKTNNNSWLAYLVRFLVKLIAQNYSYVSKQ